MQSLYINLGTAKGVKLNDMRSRKTPGRVGSSVIDHGEENRLKRLTAASTPLRGGGVWLPLHGAMVGSDSLAG
ncbi:hypothetical protein AP285_03545 [Limnospira platensis YZ]|uniref:Uncharacterized protein n=1 Tax=Limnospira indica PCC 8005 TaxID=376219 RepID=A0A9P1KKS6_9CYAN|nr:hypothetical protein AP285_03545 [Arthrospira platensis YZ]CDM97939.1 conserved protein of unknown function [Limnospira indica PCC 8005]